MVIRQAHKRRWTWPRIIAWFVMAVLVLAVAGAVGGVLWLRSAMRASLPVLDGQQQLKGLSSEATVQRDAHGVPHIQASSLDDLLVAQGYVTAQDRLWQMDMARRNADGDLAELIGSRVLEHDKVQRLLQIKTTARNIAGRLNKRDQRLFEDFARGVNAYIHSHSDSLPAEFQLLRYQPRPWEPADSIAIALSMVQMLDEHFDEKLGREQVTARLGPALAADLYPTGSWRDHPPTAADPDLTAPQISVPEAPLDESQTMLRENPEHLEDLVRLRSALGERACKACQPGSNEWAIAGAHTASGKPLLANDMHLGHAIPNLWYEVGLASTGFHAAGVSIPGMPFVVAGHNDHIAWGFTALYGDTQDVYIEEANAANPAMKHKAEIIPVRGGSVVSLDVGITPHGPVITPMLPGERRTLALKWNIYDPAIAGLPLYELDSAQNWSDFQAVAKQWWAPTLNMIYADDQGHIGYQAAGWIPLRANGLTGVPAPGGEHEWQGYVPFDAMPRSLDPAGGILATANSRITPDGDAYPLTLGWASPYRNERIWKWLAGKNGLKREDMITLQTDTFSEVDLELAQRFAYAIDQTLRGRSAKPDGSTKPKDPGKPEGPRQNDSQLRQAADLLRSWDGVMSIDSSAAAIVTAARDAWWPMVLEPRLGPGWRAYQWPESSFAQEEIVMHGGAEWLPAEYKSWDELLASAVRKGLDSGGAPADLKTWKYGYAHPLEIEHPLYGLLPWLRSWTGTGVVPQSGGHSTVKQVGRTFGPSQRFTMDWSDVDASTENIVSGESGNPLSPYYSDQFTSWYWGLTFALPFTPAAVRDQSVHTLRLLP